MTAEEFLSYFSQDRFIKDLRARSKDGVLTEMSRSLAEDDDIRDPGLLLEMIRRRESLGSTGLGNGVAVPHGRSTAATRTKVVFARSQRGIGFDAVDGQPCHIFFLIVAPYDDQRQEYLPLLGKIVEAVSREKIREKLRAVSSFDEFEAVVREAMGE
ncbi:PTS sugar transporter subunit IIA [Candidatus Eisenbacteria bacterium]|uniref:PTS sugar transporter subunit IIA n=1 Tax=Eiseniibacteriota bacterium TaxID=2212470 RepID=A0ABV6YK88_UNCEI